MAGGWRNASVPAPLLLTLPLRLDVLRLVGVVLGSSGLFCLLLAARLELDAWWERRRGR